MKNIKLLVIIILFNNLFLIKINIKTEINLTKTLFQIKGHLV